jgi:hypothetical protein
VGSGDVVFGSEAAWRNQRGPGGDHQRAVRASERGAENFDSTPVHRTVRRELREVVVKGGVNHTIRHRRTNSQAFQVFEITSLRLGAGGRKRLGARIRSSHSDHLMTRVNQIMNNGHPNKACSACYENSHSNFSFTIKMMKEGIRSSWKVRNIFAIVPALPAFTEPRLVWSGNAHEPTTTSKLKWTRSPTCFHC